MERATRIEHKYFGHTVIILVRVRCLHHPSPSEPAYGPSEDKGEPQQGSLSAEHKSGAILLPLVYGNALLAWHPSGSSCAASNTDQWKPQCVWIVDLPGLDMAIDFLFSSRQSLYDRLTGS